MLAMLSLLMTTATAEAGEPDLRFENIDATYIQTTDTFYLTVQVKNDGDAAAGGFWVDVFTDGDWDVCADLEWDSDNTAGLAVGATQWFSFTLDGALVDSDDIFMTIDVDDQVAESNEKNNSGVAFALPSNPNEPRISFAWHWFTNPDCLVDFVDGFGWFLADDLEMFYAKLRVL